MINPFKKMNRRLEDKYGIITTVIAPNTRFDGMINATEGVQISGYFEGEVISQSLVWIGKDGRVEGNIKSPSVISEGEIVGNIESAKHVELRAECRMTGNITTENIHWKHFINVTWLTEPIDPAQVTDEDLFGSHWAKYGK